MEICEATTAMMGMGGATIPVNGSTRPAGTAPVFVMSSGGANGSVVRALPRLVCVGRDIKRGSTWKPY